MNTTSDIWWRQITGARNFLQKTADALTNGKSAVICLAENTPWLNKMREVLTDFLQKKFGGRKTVRKIDASTVDKPDIFVFENFCSEDVQAQLIPIDEDAYVKFLANCTDSDLNDACVWIRGANKNQAADWYAFVADYRKFGGEGIFLVETGADCDLVGKAGVEIFSAEDEISEYDCFAFNMFIAAQFGKGDKFTKRYLAELAANATGLDVERAAECIKLGNGFLKNPAAVLMNKTVDEVNRAVWVTQLKLIFPQLEIFRRDFVTKYESQIKNRLPYAVSDRKTICEADEAELGDLYAIFVGGWDIEPHDWAKLKDFRDARNKLAHLETLTAEQVQTLLNS